MPRRPSLLLATAALALAACQAAPPPTPAPVAAGPAGWPAAAPVAARANSATIQVRPSFRDGAVRQLMAAITPFTVASIDHMVLKLYLMPSEGVENLVDAIDVAAPDLGNTVTFTNLAFDSDYRIRAYAYKAPGTAANDKISVDNGSYVDMSVAFDDAPAAGALVVTLADQTFSGQATNPGLTVNDGVLVHSGAITAAANQPVPYDLVSTFAGGAGGFAEGSPGQFDDPNDVAVDADGNVYVADWLNNRIRKITPGGVVSTLAGDGTYGSVDGTGAGAQFEGPLGIAVDGSGNMFVSEANCIRKVTPAGVVTTLAGDPNVGGWSDGTGSGAWFNLPSGLTVAPNGDVIVADTDNNRIRRVTQAGVVTTIAGDGSPAWADGNGTGARLRSPQGVVFDRLGNLYVADTENYRIRKIEPDGDVTTVAGDGTPGAVDGTGTGASFYYPGGIALDRAGHLLIADGRLVRRMSPLGAVATVAGSTTSGTADGAPGTARFNHLLGLAIGPNDELFLADSFNNRIRRLIVDVS